MSVGPRSRALAERSQRVESAGVTSFAEGWPVFLERGQGARVWDADDHEYLDLTSAFGVMSIGHANEAVADAVSRQARTLLHGMGDVHPTSIKVELLEALNEWTPEGLDLSVLGVSGSDSVEAALKCAALVTGRPGVIAFAGSYHGLSAGALSVTSRRDFRDPFAGRLSGLTTFFDFPSLPDEGARVLAAIERALTNKASGLTPTGAIIFEPIQGRGGVVIPPPGFVGGLREICDRHDLLLIADEIFTGLGRTGAAFAVDHEGVVPDLLCVGKALGGGMPISACVGGARSWARWPKAKGEALHTGTFLGHPGACAAALAALGELSGRDLVQRSARLGEHARSRLRSEAQRLSIQDVRGRGLMIGVELESGQRAFEVTKRGLDHGLLLLPSGPTGSVLSLTPPLVIEEALLDEALDRLFRCLS